MFAFSFDFIDKVFLLLNDLLVGLFQVLNSLFQELIFLEQFFVLFLFAFDWLDLFSQLGVLFLELSEFSLVYIGAFNFDDFVVFFSLSFNLLFEGLNLSFQVSDLNLVIVLVPSGFLGLVFLFQVLKLFPQFPDSLIELI